MKAAWPSRIWRRPIWTAMAALISSPSAGSRTTRASTGTRVRNNTSARTISGMFPLFLDLTERLAVVIGGGPVGRRKALAVLAAGGRVRLICLEQRPAEMSDPLLDWLTEPYTRAHLEGASLVFAAGPADLNA